MAEFIEVARAKRKMCKVYAGECGECKLQGNCSLLNVCAYSDDDVKKFENEVMSWAAEHPEPLYPTWGEWLNTMGLVYYTKVDGVKIYFTRDIEIAEPIPVDIAQKLGIEPKEE